MSQRSENYHNLSIHSYKEAVESLRFYKLNHNVSQLVKIKPKINVSHVFH